MIRMICLISYISLFSSFTTRLFLISFNRSALAARCSSVTFLGKPSFIHLSGILAQTDPSGFSIK